MKTIDPLVARQLLCSVAVAFVAAASSADARWPQVGPRVDRVIDESRVTYFVSPEGDDACDGRSRAAAFRTMQKAADAVQPGETVLVLRGVYADGFHYKGVGRPDAYVTFRAEPGVEIYRQGGQRVEGAGDLLETTSIPTMNKRVYP